MGGREASCSQALERRGWRRGGGHPAEMTWSWAGNSTAAVTEIRIEVRGSPVLKHAPSDVRWGRGEGQWTTNSRVGHHVGQRRRLGGQALAAAAGHGMPNSAGGGREEGRQNVSHASWKSRFAAGQRLSAGLGDPSSDIAAHARDEMRDIALMSGEAGSRRHVARRASLPFPGGCASG
jgi:hypothetical protein